MANEYPLDWQSTNLDGTVGSVPGKSRITVNEKTEDTTSTSITLTGKGRANYGEKQQENLLKLLENFASPTEPANATIGQIWWKTTDPTRQGMMVCKSLTPTGGYNVEWVPVGDPLVRVAYNYEYNRMVELFKSIVGTTTAGTNCSDSFGWGQTVLADSVPLRHLPLEPALNPNWVFLLHKWKDIASIVGVDPAKFESDGFIIEDQHHIEEGPGGLPGPGLPGEAKGIATIISEYERARQATLEVYANRFNIIPSNLELLTYSPPIARASYWLDTTSLIVNFEWPDEPSLYQYFTTGGYLKIIPLLINPISDDVTDMWVRLINGLGGGILIKGCSTNDQANNPTFSANISIFELDGTLKTLYKANEYEVGGGSIGGYGGYGTIYGTDSDLGWGDITVQGRLSTNDTIEIVLTFENERPTEVKGLLNVLLESRKIQDIIGSLTFNTVHPVMTHGSFIDSGSGGGGGGSGGGGSGGGLDEDLTGGPFSLWAWGANNHGQLGDEDGTLQGKSSPIQVGSLITWEAIPTSNSNSNSTLVIDDQGRLWASGDNYYGQLGVGDLNDYVSPVQVGTLKVWKQTSSNYTTSYAIRNDGTLWSWGLNASGQLGDGTVISRSSPIQIGTGTNWHRVTAGGASAHAIKTDGTIWTWGANVSGQLGVGDIINRSSPVQVGTSNDWKSINNGVSHSLALKTDGTLWAWGANNFGALGQGNMLTSSTPVQVGTLNTWSAIAAGDSFSLAIKTDGTLWSWGYNNNGQLGLGYQVNRSSPTQVGTLSTWKTISAGLNFAAALKTDGTLWTWGNNVVGQGGVTGALYRSYPIQVGTLNTWKAISCGNAHMVAFADPVPGSNPFGTGPGSLWTWGPRIAASGLGVTGGFNLTTPTQVGNLTSWKQVICEDSSSLAVKTDGTLWAWGGNNNYEFGNGTNVARSSPVKIGTGTNWELVAKTSYASFAIKTDGTLWAWGSNIGAQLGLGFHDDVSFEFPRVTMSHPTQVGTLTNWRYVTSNSSQTIFALKTDGTLWGWGSNPGGYLFLGSTGLKVSSPIQIGSATDWQQIAASAQHVAGVKTDGTLWTWGWNSEGGLGNGLSGILQPDGSYSSDGSRYSPGQVGSLTNWKQVACLRNAMLAVKTDGTLWAWGGNYEGQLGLGDQVDRSSPVQVGTRTDWKHVSSNDSKRVYASRTDGTLWAWGMNYPVQLGVGPASTRVLSPMQVGTDLYWNIVSGRTTVLAIKEVL